MVFRYADLVQLLVETHGASVDALSLARKTALHMAAETGQMSVANTLLLMNADANATDEVIVIAIHAIIPMGVRLSSGLLDVSVCNTDYLFI